MAGQISLAWDASADSRTGGYIVSYGQTPGRYDNNIDVGNVTQYTTAPLTEGNAYYFAVKGYSVDHSLQSVYSNETSANVPAGAPVVSFTASTLSGNAPLNISFTPTVSGTVQAWDWDFGDGTHNTGTSSTVPAAIKSYTAAGKYTVQLTITYSGGTVNSSKNISVAPVAQFTATPTTGTAPLQVNLTDTSTGKPDTWLWDFGDNTRSSMASPVHSYTLPGTYTVSLQVAGGGVNGSNTATQTIVVQTASGGNTTTGSALPVAGLVAAYGFEEGYGTRLTADASGLKQHGILYGATPVMGKFGYGLKLDGYSQQVSIRDTNALDLSNAMTLEAWVYPTLSRGARAIIVKENTAGSVYSLYGNTGRNVPRSSIYTDDYHEITGINSLPLNQWSHLASTYDGISLRLYVNGMEVAQTPQTGTLLTSVGALKLGGNAMWGECFKGILDEVRIYKRALTASEIQNDMTTSVIATHPPQTFLGDNTPGDTLAPLPMGTAKAVQTTVVNAGLLNRLSIYLDSTSQSSPLLLGLYSDNQGHPGTRLATGKIMQPKPGEWNALPVAAVNLTANTRYWLAILNPQSTVNPIVNLRTGTTHGKTEISNGKDLTDLPASWSNGMAVEEEAWAEQGMGY